MADAGRVHRLCECAQRCIPVRRLQRHRQRSACAYLGKLARRSRQRHPPLAQIQLHPELDDGDGRGRFPSHQSAHPWCEYISGISTGASIHPATMATRQPAACAAAHRVAVRRASRQHRSRELHLRPLRLADDAVLSGRAAELCDRAHPRQQDLFVCRHSAAVRAGTRRERNSDHFSARAAAVGTGLRRTMAGRIQTAMAGVGAVRHRRAVLYFQQQLFRPDAAQRRIQRPVRQSRHAALRLRLAAAAMGVAVVAEHRSRPSAAHRLLRRTVAALPLHRAVRADAGLPAQAALAQLRPGVGDCCS